MINMERTNSILAVLNQAEIRLHALKNTIPCGIRSIDDETDNKINRLNKFISDLKSKIGQ